MIAMDTDVDKSWQKVINYLKERVSHVNFRGWIMKIKVESISEQEIILVVPHAFVQNQVRNRYQSLIEEAISEVLQKQLVVNYKVDASRFEAEGYSEETQEDDFELASQPGPQQTLGLSPKYTLKSFVVGFTNNLAYAAAQAVVNDPGTSYNPLFIYGPSGVGKTHLMQAIGNELIKKDPYMKLVYVSSERFMVDFIEAIQSKKTNIFRQKYRSCHILLVDDIQFISGRDSTQEEFFHVFNELHSRGAQVVLTSDRPPHEIQKLEPRLASRFQGGLMVDIQLPDFDTRMAILKAKLAEKGEDLPEEYLRVIAETSGSNTRELEGKLVQISQMKKLTQQLPDEATLMRLVGRPDSPSALPDHKKVLISINNYFNLKMTDLTGPRRQKELVLPRQIAMYVLYEDCKISMEKIGQMLGGRDHTTVLHGIKKINDSIPQNQELERQVSEVRQLFH